MSSDTIEPAKLIDDVRQCLDDVHARLRRNPPELKEWTRAVKRALAQLGREEPYSCRICAGGIESAADFQEFLYDLCWLDYDDGGFLRGATLIAESEWGTDLDIDTDFQKLIIGRARLKLMVFGEKNENNEKTAKKLATHLKRHPTVINNQSDTYLLAGYEGSKQGFSYFLLSGTGACQKI